MQGSEHLKFYLNRIEIESTGLQKIESNLDPSTFKKLGSDRLAQIKSGSDRKADPIQTRFQSNCADLLSVVFKQNMFYA